MRMQKPNRFIAHILFALTLTANLAPAGLAANNHGLKAKEVEVSTEFASRTLSRMEALPEVPQYTGQSEFQNGVLSPNARGGMQVTYSLSVRESQQAVMQWYQDALKLYKWESSGLQSSNNLSFRKGGAFLVVTVNPSYKAGFASELVIAYRSTGQR